MADEPRRSVRAGKGVHSKNLEPSPEPPAPTPKPKASKSKSKKAKPAEADEGEQPEDVIRCVCGSDEGDEEGRVMIACDKCDVWQHNDCMGITEDPKNQPKTYFCEECKPQNHKKLLAAIERDDKPWEEVARRKAEEAALAKQKKGKKGKGGRASVGVKEETPAKEKTKTPTPAVAESTPGAQERSKRKQSSETDGLDAQPTKLRKPSAQDKASAEVPASTRKASAPPPSQTKVQTQKRQPKDDVANSIDELQPSKRQNTAKFIKGKFDAQVKSLSSSGQFRIPDGHTPSSLSEQTAIAIEHAMFKAYCGPKPDFGGQYKLQMTAIVANVAQNSDLVLRLLNQDISAQQLARMTSDDMASEERQREAAELKKQAEKQSTLVQEDSGRPLMRRTHKGEEYIEDPNQAMPSDSLPSAAPLHRRESDFLPPQSPTAGQDVTMSEDGAAPPSLDRRTSSNFNIKDVWQSVGSPVKEQTEFAQPAPPTQQHGEAVEPKQEQDAAIDRLLEDEDVESAPYSPGDYEGPPVAWRGHVDMPNIGKFKAYAQHVAGANLESRGPMGNMFPDSLTMSGRISSQKADDYLSSLGAARSTDVVVFNVVPDGPETTLAKQQFQKLWKYFVDRDRWGVVSDQMHREHVTDTYIVPLKAGREKLPTFLQRLDYNIIEDPRSKDMLLAVFVIKWRHQSHSQPQAVPPPGSAMSPNGSMPSQGSSATTAGLAGNVMSPLATPVSAQQPHQQLPHHGQAGGPPAFPENPYGGAAMPQQNGAANMAQAILGEFWSCPTAQALITSMGPPGVPEPLLKNLRSVLEKHPSARTNFQEFQQLMAAVQ